PLGKWARPPLPAAFLGGLLHRWRRLVSVPEFLGSYPLYPTHESEAASHKSLSFCKPARILLLTVPNGKSSFSANSLCVKPFTKHSSISSACSVGSSFSNKCS